MVVQQPCPDEQDDKTTNSCQQFFLMFLPPRVLWSTVVDHDCRLKTPYVRSPNDLGYRLVADYPCRLPPTTARYVTLAEAIRGM